MKDTKFYNNLFDNNNLRWTLKQKEINNTQVKFLMFLYLKMVLLKINRKNKNRNQLSTNRKTS